MWTCRAYTCAHTHIIVQYCLFWLISEETSNLRFPFKVTMGPWFRNITYDLNAAEGLTRTPLGAKKKMGKAPIRNGWDTSDHRDFAMWTQSLNLRTWRRRWLQDPSYLLSSDKGLYFVALGPWKIYNQVLSHEQSRVSWGEDWAPLPSGKVGATVLGTL